MFEKNYKFLLCLLVINVITLSQTYKIESKFMKDLLYEEDKDMPKNIIVEKNSENVQINCKTNQRVSKILWRIETINVKKFIAIIAENGKVSKGWKETHAINASLSGQNTLIIKNAIIKNAGKYSCQLFYNSHQPHTFYSEIIIVASNPQTGLIEAPAGYYNWNILYSGNLKPFFRCSNNEDINSVQKSDLVSDFPSVNLTFNGCFTDKIPETCTLMTADYFNNRFTYFKSYNITIKDQDIDKAGWNELKENEKINLFTFPPDRIIMLDSNRVLEFECDLSPVPNHYSWIHINQDKQCFFFEQNLKKMNKNDQKYYIASSTASSSNLFIYDVGASAAGKYICIGTYWTMNMKKYFFSVELIIVIKHDDFVIMYLVEETTDLFMIKFEILYRGNLKPILQCSSARILTTKTSLDFQNTNVSKL